MGTTPNRAYPYPDPTDPNDVPADMQQLAAAVDSDVEAHVDAADPHPTYETATEAQARITAHVAAAHPADGPLHKPTRHTFVGARGTKTGTQFIAGGTAEAVTYSSEGFDSDNIHDGATPSRFTVPPGMTGKWRILGQVFVSGGGGFIGDDGVTVRKNGVVAQTFYVESNVITSNNGLQFHTVLPLVAGDFIEVWVENAAGAGNSVELSTTDNFLVFEFLGA